MLQFRVTFFSPLFFYLRLKAQRLAEWPAIKAGCVQGPRLTPEGMEILLDFFLKSLSVKSQASPQLFSGVHELHQLGESVLIAGKTTHLALCYYMYHN